jgi:NAD(P)-dependent dehydrogenase (short-subunit alcohol dehydrogenase family)
MSNQRSVNGAVALVTGANRGIGAAFVQGLLDGGARRVYAAARDPQAQAALAQRDARVIAVTLDITDDASVRAAAQQLGDVNLLINNAGVAHGARLIAAADLSAAQREMEVNYFGLLRMCRAFAPVLAANGGGTLINLLSILSRVASPASGSYSASKAAALSLTQAVRAELQAQGTRVIGVLPGYVETDMTERINAPKIQPIDVVRATLEALQTDQEEVYPGEAATQVAALLLQNPKAVERQFALSIVQGAA